ncbi:MAG TPA: hypothetical protein P5026_08475 [Kiritimatiellia bacterium]|nr:hypothetical protein [Kiritimatiellia bacterium]HRU70040.1 hypothetical protein [Kiritimatiellia bacterium]
MIRKVKRTLSVWVLAAGSLAGLAQTAEGPRLPRGIVPAAPVYSSDGTVAVFAPAHQAGYRMPVLTFVTQFSAELQRVLRLKLGSQLAPLEVAIGGQSDGDTRVLTVRLRDTDGVVRERIELPDPEAADLERFRRAICVALLRGWMVEAGGTEATMQNLPAWLIDGLLRYIDRERRQMDIDRTLLLWSRACLPPAATLIEMDSHAATREPAVAAVLASWMMERRDGASHLERVLRAVATGTPWSVGQVARLLSGDEDPLAFDEHVDRKLLAESRVVARPGLTTAGIVRRFRAHLLLYPAFYDKSLGDTHPWCTFQQAVARSKDPEVRAAAAAQSLRMKIAAVGRDGMLLAVSDAYGAFLNALARGAEQGELTRLLLEADGMRGTLERRVAGGGALQRDAGGAVQGETGAQRK